MPFTPINSERKTMPTALIYVARAIALFDRSGFHDDAEAFTSWLMVNFAEVDYENALTMEEAGLPEKESVEQDYSRAEEALKNVLHELERTNAKNDIVVSWQLAMGAYLARRDKRNGPMQTQEGRELAFRPGN